MNEPTPEERELERELEALIPSPMSADCQQQLEHRLMANQTASGTALVRHRGGWLGLAAAILLALGLAWTIRAGWWDGGDQQVAKPPRPVVPADQRSPSLLVFRNSWSDGPQSLDELLDAHSRTLLPKSESPLSVAISRQSPHP